MMLPPKKAKSVRVASDPSDLSDPHRNPKMNKKGRFYFLHFWRQNTVI